MTDPAASPGARKVPPSVIFSTPPHYSHGVYAVTARDSHLFFPPSNFRAGAERSTAQADVRTKGIYSYDPILDKDANELWGFLMSNLGPPRLEVQLRGTHTVSRNTGPGSTTHRTVTDFVVKIDVSNYVLPEWSRIAAQPSSSKCFGGNGNSAPTLRETLEEYTRSDNPFKEFRMKKLVLRDYTRVMQLLKELVRSTGYRRTIGVSFPQQNYKVVALASNESSRACILGLLDYSVTCCALDRVPACVVHCTEAGRPLRL